MSDSPAVVFGDQTITYAGLEARANRVANLLTSRGIGAGDRVALSCPNVPYFAEIFWGVRALGATLVPIDISHTAAEVAERAAGCRAHFAFESLGSLMVGDIAWEAHRLRGGEGEFFLITIDTGFPEPLEPPEFYHPLMARQRDDFGAQINPPIEVGSTDPAGRWLLLVPLADPDGWPVLDEAAAAGAAVVLIPHVTPALVESTIVRAGVTRQIR